ncbi:Ulp1 family isopeptidase [Rickettsia endosymbiont of Orchestes rusci]|uniref:Ulp1 family isopeptidase n=1 Tax=Rickettsia endosymbiont of Orchestes rusci TaxID=3066250 RepID=UPI00313ECD84
MAKQKENVPIIFTLSLGGKDAILQRINEKGAEQKISVISLKPNKESNISDKDRILREIIEESGRKTPILNIQHPSNDHYPIFGLQDLTNFEILGIKTSLTFSNYKPLLQNPKLENIWKGLLAKIDHVFFANEQDQNYAISHGDIAREKTTNIQTISDANSVISKILQKPVNILISGSLPDKAKLDELVKTAKDQNSRIVIKSNPLSVEGASNAIALKFGIENPDQLFGIKLEVEEILKDQATGAKNLEKYVSQLSEQFQKDLSKAEINPVDIYFDLSDKQKISNMEKDMSPNTPSDDQSPSSPANDIPNTAHLQDAIKPKALIEEQTTLTPEPKGFFNRIFNYFKEIAKSFKEKIFGKKEEEAKPEKEQNIIPDDKLPPSIEATNIPEVNKQPSPTPIMSSATTMPALTTAINDLIKPDYLYTDDNIREVIETSLGKDKIYTQQISLDWGEELNNVMLSQAVKEVKEGGKKAAVIPINTGREHWTGMVITYDTAKDQMTFTYNDPNGTPLNVRPKLENLINQVAPNAKIEDLHTQQQANDKDCGAFVTDNLIKIANGEKIFSLAEHGNKGSDLRQNHATILTQELAKQQVQEVRSKVNIGIQNPSFVQRISSKDNDNKEVRR